MDFVFNLIALAGGLAFFLFGMNMLGTGLERVAGGKLERTLQRLTSNIFKGVIIGALVTAAIQSSSATTVIVVGLVNAGILKLRAAIPVIMGANIGTTVTGQILRLAELDASGTASFWLQMIKPTTLAPLVSIIGIALFMISKRKKQKMIGEILLGFGILFQGMFVMTAAVEPLSELPIFAEIFATLQNPILGVLAGTLITAAIQSSSASVGILQALAATGAITCSAAFPIIMGQNIGTCVTSLIACVGAKVNAKRAAMVHLYFNIIGTVVFLCGVYAIQHFVGFPFWDDPISMGGIANFHTLFNVVVTVLFLPFTRLLEKLAVLTIRGKEGDSSLQAEAALQSLDERFLASSPSLAIAQSEKVIEAMGAYAQENFTKTFGLLGDYDHKKVEAINETEDIIDRMEDALNNYLLKLTNTNLSEQESRNVTHLLKLNTEFERIGDYSINLTEVAEILFDRETAFSPKAMEELRVVYDAIEEILELTIETYRTGDLEIAVKVEPLEETVDLMVEVLKAKHIDRLRRGKCTIDGGFAFLEALSNIERISDHCSNIAVAIIGHQEHEDDLNRHEYLRKMHAGYYENYGSYLDNYRTRYLDNISIKSKDETNPERVKKLDKESKKKEKKKS